MALTGLDIFKLLPKTNCKKCGYLTCLAFAMALANGKSSVDACPELSAEARETLSSAAEPPIRSVNIGSGEKIVKVGGETELFRHDKRFNHPVAIAVAVNDNEDVEAKIDKINSLSFERVGQHYEVDMVALMNTSGDAAVFKEAAVKAAAGTDKNFILVTRDTLAMEAALQVLGPRKPLLYAADGDNYAEMTELAKAHGCALAVRAGDLHALAELTAKVIALGYRELVLDPGAQDSSRILADLTQLRRLAVRKKFRPFAYPVITFTTKEDPAEEMMQIASATAKYADIIVVRTDRAEYLLPALTLRENIYADPQKPVAVEPGLYAVGDAGEHSPVYCTTNFSLTYFLVEGEVSATRIPSYILSVDTNGTSVLTAYADNKFTAETIARAMEEYGLEQKVGHKNIVIPGAVAVLKGKLEEESGWNVIVGPREASGIQKFAKLHFS
ncbi:MAG: acetyl-CoA decarbonylase/synthase complex subunit gamma [Firmicutes bacterium]|nr:acetyl-CoA decarbonylase/synthase complex subunit gamma [Bacillota bacterium]